MIKIILTVGYTNSALDNTFIDAIEELLRPNGKDVVTRGAEEDVNYFQFIGDATEIAIMEIEKKMLAYLSNPNVTYRLNIVRGLSDRAV